MEGDKKDREALLLWIFDQKGKLSFSEYALAVFSSLWRRSCSKIMSPTAPKKDHITTCGLTETQEDWLFPQQAPDLKATEHL